jgi:hypothetical protein
MRTGINNLSWKELIEKSIHRAVISFLKIHVDEMNDFYCDELNSLEFEHNLGWYDEWHDDESYEITREFSPLENITWWPLYQEGYENEKTE